MVELGTRTAVMSGYEGNHHEKLGLEGASCTSQFSISDKAGTSPDPACNITKTWSSQPYDANWTPDFSSLLVFSMSCSYSSPIWLFVIHNSTIITEYKVKSFLSTYHVMIMSSPQVQPTLSIAYTGFSIHRVQHTLRSPYIEFSITQECLSSFHSHHYELTPECTSAKCKSVRKPHANLPDTPVDLIGAPKWFQMLPGPPGAKQSALGLWESILRRFWKHLQLWRCIQDATRFDL